MNSTSNATDTLRRSVLYRLFTFGTPAAKSLRQLASRQKRNKSTYGGTTYSAYPRLRAKTLAVAAQERRATGEKTKDQ